MKIWQDHIHILVHFIGKSRGGGVIGEKKRKRELYIIMYVRTYFIDVYIYTRLAFNVNNHANFSKNSL